MPPTHPDRSIIEQRLHRNPNCIRGPAPCGGRNTPRRLRRPPERRAAGGRKDRVLATGPPGARPRFERSLRRAAPDPRGLRSSGRATRSAAAGTIAAGSAEVMVSRMIQVPGGVSSVRCRTAPSPEPRVPARDLDDWSRGSMGWEEDLPPGEKMVAYSRQTLSLRKVPMEGLVFNLLEEGGPLPPTDSSEEAPQVHWRSFSNCRTKSTSGRPKTPQIWRSSRRSSLRAPDS